MAGLAADTPKTDRELLLGVAKDICYIREGMYGKDGKGGLCAKVDQHGEDIKSIKAWQASVMGIVSFILILLGSGGLLSWVALAILK